MKKKIIALTLTVLMLFLGNVALAMITSMDVLRTYQNEAQFYTFFSVTDESGELVDDLQSESIELSIGSEKLTSKIETLSEAKLNVGYVFAVDISKSLNENKFDDIKDTVNSWIAKMDDDDMAAIVTFGNEISILSDFNNDKAQLSALVDDMKPKDNKTQLYNGLLKTLDIAKRQSPDLPIYRVIVVLSDGMDDFPSGATIHEVSAKVSESGIPVYAVGIDKRENENELNDLGGVARLSGGDLYIAEEAKLDDGLNDVHDRIMGTYVAVCTLPNCILDGEKHGLIINAVQNGIAIESSLDVRIKSVKETQTPMPQKTSYVTPVSSEQKTDIPIGKILIIIVVLCLAGAVVFLIVSVQKKKRAKELADNIAERESRDALENGIKVEPQTGNAIADKTKKLDETEEPPTTDLKNNGTDFLDLYTIILTTQDGVEYRRPIRGRVTVGRGKKNDVIIDDPSVSALHCVFSINDMGLCVEDLDSTNGTVVINEQKRLSAMPEEKVTVKSGDIVKIGRTELVVCIENNRK